MALVMVWLSNEVVIAFSWLLSSFMVGSCLFWKRYILHLSQVKRDTILEEILCFWEVLSDPTSFHYLVLEDQEITSCRFSINGVTDRFAWVEISASSLLKWVLGHKTEMFEEWRCGISYHWHIAFPQNSYAPPLASS